MNLRCIFSRSLCYFTPCVNEKQVNFVKAWTPDHHNNNSCIIKKIKCEKRSIMFQKKKGEKDWGPWVIFHQYGTLIKKKFIQSLHLFLCFRVFHVFLNNIKYFSFSLSFPEVKNGDRQCDGRNTQFWVCRRKVSRLFLFFLCKMGKTLHLHHARRFLCRVFRTPTQCHWQKTCKCLTWLSDTVPFKQVSLLPMITNTWKEFSTYNILISYFFWWENSFLFHSCGQNYATLPP